MELEFNPDIAKEVSFSATIEGVQRVGLITKFVITYNGVEYGFVGKIEQGTLKFEIPKLNEIFKTISTTRQSLPARIEVVSSDGNIFSPWKESVMLVVPQVVRANLESKNIDLIAKPSINVEIKEDEYKSEPEKKKKKEEKKLNDKSEKFAHKINDFLDYVGG